MEHQQPNPGLIGGLANMAKNLFALFVSRIELAALELSEARKNLLKLLMVGALGVIAVWFAIAFWTVLIVVLAWDTWGWRILFVIAAAFSVMAVGIFYYAKSVLDQGKLSMPVTIAELRKDRDALL